MIGGSTFNMMNTDNFLVAADAARSVGDAASLLKDEVGALGRAASKKIDASRLVAADGLDRTASAVHQGSQKLTGLADSTADTLSTTAKYLREHDITGMMPDVARVVRRSPGLALLVAGAIGFAAGCALGWSKSSGRNV
jgi:hypothetical protein